MCRAGYKYFLQAFSEGRKEKLEVCGVVETFDDAAMIKPLLSDDYQR